MAGQEEIREFESSISITYNGLLDFSKLIYIVLGILATKQLIYSEKEYDVIHMICLVAASDPSDMYKPVRSNYNNFFIKMNRKVFNIYADKDVIAAIKRQVEMPNNKYQYEVAE